MVLWLRKFQRPDLLQHLDHLEISHRPGSRSTQLFVKRATKGSFFSDQGFQHLKLKQFSDDVLSLNAVSDVYRSSIPWQYNHSNSHFRIYSMWESQETIDFSETTSCKIRVLCMAGLVGFAANVAMSHPSALQSLKPQSFLNWIMTSILIILIPWKSNFLPSDDSVRDATPHEVVVTATPRAAHVIPQTPLVVSRHTLENILKAEKWYPCEACMWRDSRIVVFRSHILRFKMVSPRGWFCKKRTIFCWRTFGMSLCTR